MASMIGLFAAVGDNIPIFRKEKIVEATCEGIINRFHYRGTTTFLLVACLLVTCTEWISGTDSIIECMHGDSLPDQVVNMYCYISGTFSVPKAYVSDDVILGQHVSQTGVGPYNPATDEVVYKNYYQWVPFMLFLQGIMFYLPHIIFKMMEGKKVKQIMNCLNLFVLDRDTRKNAENDLAVYFVETMGSHDLWSMRVLFAHLTYLINVVGQIFFTDCFLGYEFSTYGVNAASFINDDPEDRTDAMARVFPRVTKCTFHKYGPSGTIQRHDIQCILPINIINEKIYIFMWIWFAVLATLTVLDILCHVGLVSLKGVRWKILKRKIDGAPTFKLQDMDIDLSLISRSLTFGDWKLLYCVIKNMDCLTAAEWLELLTDKIRKEKESKAHNTETLPLKSKIENDF